MKQRKQYEKKINCRLAAIGIGTLFAACLLIYGNIYVNAAPATLLSQSSVVYETADENSNAVGNLVQGNTFELVGSITAENGETWHTILMNNGVQGYMKGEVSTEIENAAPAEENSSVAETEEGNREGETEEEETSSEGKEEGGSAENTLPISSNTQKKTYSIKADADRIKTKVQTDDAAQDSMPQKTRVSVDKTLILIILVILFSVMLIYLSYKKLMQMITVSWRHAEYSGKLWAGHSKARKRKKARKAKKKRTAKEAKKWKNNSLQN